MEEVDNVINSSPINREQVSIKFIENIQARFQELYFNGMQNTESMDLAAMAFNQDKIERLRNHPRNRCIKLIEDLGNDRAYFQVDFGGKSRKYKGLTNVLKAVFFTRNDDPTDPNHKIHRKANYISMGMHTIGKHDLILKMTSSEPKGTTLCKEGGRGKVHGKIVHAELERMIRCFTDAEKYENNMTNFFYSVSKELDAPPLPDGCTMRILKKLSLLGIVPIATEFPIFDEHTGIATSIDLLGVYPDTGELCAFELKTGCDSKEDFFNDTKYPKMRGTMKNYPSNPYYQASIQLLLGCIILRHRYDIKIDHGYIVHSCSKERKVFIYNLPVTMVGGESKAYDGTPYHIDADLADRTRQLIYKDVCMYMKKLEMDKTDKYLSMNKRKRREQAQEASKTKLTKKRLAKAWATGSA
jgi:hypothetical protein